MAYILARPFVYLFALITIVNLCVRNTDRNILGLLCALCATVVCILLAWMTLRRSVIPWAVVPALAAAFFLHTAYQCIQRSDLERQLPRTLYGENTVVVEWMRQYPKFTMVSGWLVRREPIRISLMIPAQEICKALYHGDTIKARLRATKLQPANSRYLQTYQRYLHHKGYQFEGRASTVIALNTGSEPWSPWRLSQHLANNFKSALEKCSTDKRTTQLITGLLLGDKSGMDRDLKEAFREGGLSHILAVSGMHLGILYGMLKLAFIPIRKSPFRPLVKFENAIHIALLWAFVFVTGCEVAALRAVLMLSLFMMAKISGRNTCPVNALFATAFILQFINPNHIFDIGYQLSCVAVLAIFLIFPSIKRLIYPKARVLRWLWEASAVSLSVQMLIMPLCLYHFASFPIHFSLTNILWLPLTPAIMFAGLLGAGAQLLHVEGVAYFALKVASAAVHSGMSGLIYLNELPFSNLKNTYLEAEDLWLYYLGYLYIGTRTFKTIRAGLFRVSLVAGLFTIMYGLRELANNVAPEIMFFSKSGNMQCELYYQNQAWSTAPASKEAEAYRIRKRTRSIVSAEPEQMKCMINVWSSQPDSILQVYTAGVGSKTHPMRAYLYRLKRDTP
ncbi:MAG: ComEC/Rec2 family competence protein [Saprospiraceae bacterium]|nr:ComEC/Rec2 family competence protein [Saprospiraceae bacterium]